MSFKFNPITGTLDLVNATGGTTTQVWSRISSTVNALNASTVDSIANTSFKSLKYIVTIFNDANTSYRSFEYSVLNDNGSYKETKTHKLSASGPNVQISTFNNAGNFELIINNNEAFNVQVEIGRLVLG